MQDLWIHFSYGDLGWGDEVLQGAVMTILLALATLPLGLVLGLLLGLAKNSQDPYLKLSANIYTTLFRGLPELLTLFLVFFGIPIFVSQLTQFFFGIDVEVGPFLAGLIALGVVFSSYASEVFLSAFRGIPQGQYEGAESLGLSRLKTFVLVIFPQLLRLALPGLSNLWLILLKETSLVSVIAIHDTMFNIKQAAATTNQHMSFFILGCVIYLIFTVISQIGIYGLNKWLLKGERI